MKTKLSKKNFVEAINEIKKTIKYQKDFNKFFKIHSADGCIFQPDCSDALIKILHVLFEEKDSDNLIYNFCHKSDLKGAQKKNSFEYDDNSGININNAEDLYDYLTIGEEVCSNK